MQFKDKIEVVNWIIKENLRIAPKLTILKTILYTFTQLFPILVSYYLAYLIDMVQESGVDSTKILVIVGVFALIQLLNSTSSDYLGVMTWFVEKVQYKFKLGLIDKVQSLPMSVTEKPDFVNKYSRALTNIPAFQNQTTRVIDIFAGVIKILVYFIILIGTSPVQVVISLIVAIPRFYILGDAIKKLLAFSITNFERLRLAWMNLELIGNTRYFPEIKISESYDYLRKKYIDLQSALVKEEGKLHNGRFIISLSFGFINIFILATQLYLYVNKFITTEISIGMLTFYISNSIAYMYSIGGLIATVSVFDEANIKAKEIKEILEFSSERISSQTQEVIDTNIILNKLNKIEEIEFKNLTFRYNDSQRNILEDLNLTIKKGEKIAIVGENGAGKSTLIKLLLKLYEIENNMIFVNGFDINRIDEKSWYSKVSALMQEYNTYGFLNVRDNVDLGLGLSDKEINKSLKMAEAFEFVEQYPNKLDQVLNETIEGGIRPSTGQWQKLAIARFLHRDNELVIFDEPTASIDAVAESKIFENIFSFLREKTVIIISHRFSTVRKADRIIVLDQGKIIEDGTHEDLMKLGGKYANSYKLQAKAYN